VNVCVPMVIAPLRAVPLTFASTLNVTVPGPDPLAPPVTTIHGAPLTAVAGHLGDTVETVSWCLTHTGVIQ